MEGSGQPRAPSRITSQHILTLVQPQAPKPIETANGMSAYWTTSLKAEALRTVGELDGIECISPTFSAMSSSSTHLSGVSSSGVDGAGGETGLGDVGGQSNDAGKHRAHADEGGEDGGDLVEHHVVEYRTKRTESRGDWRVKNNCKSMLSNHTFHSAFYTPPSAYTSSYQVDATGARKHTSG